jgi:hypothetical protein
MPLPKARVQQFEVQADIVREGPLAAPDHDGRHEQVELIDQPRRDRLGGEIGTT